MTMKSRICFGPRRPGGRPAPGRKTSEMETGHKRLPATEGTLAATEALRLIIELAKRRNICPAYLTETNGEFSGVDPSPDNATRIERGELRLETEKGPSRRDMRQ